MKIYKENGETYPAIIIQDDVTAAPVGYTEVTDIVGISQYGCQGIDPKISGWYDKKCVRDKLSTAIYTKMGVAAPADVEDPTKWNLLTDAEKSIAVHMFIVGKEEFQLEVVNDDRYWILEAEKYRRWTMEVKDFRLKLMESIVFRRTLSLADAKQIIADLSQIYIDTVIDIDGATNKLQNSVRIRKMNDMYVEGLTSLADDGEVALADYLQETAGTPFEGNGFLSYAYTFRTGHTAASVSAEIMKVINSEW